MNKINNLNLQEVENNNLNMASRLGDFKDGLQLLPDYDGNSKASLNIFISSVDEFLTFVNSATPALNAYEKHVIRNGILKHITGNARDHLANTDRSTWPKIKETLKTQFLVHKHYTTVFHEIINLHIKDPYEYFRVTDLKFKELKDLIEYQYPTDDHITSVLEQIVIYEFIGKVNEPFASNIANRKPNSLRELGNLLINDFNFLKSRIHSNKQSHQHPKPVYKLPNIPPQQFPHHNFSQGPVQFQQSKDYQQKQFAPQQNKRNAQQIKPVPMSTQTRQSFQQKSNFSRPNNYFTRQNEQFGNTSKRPDYITEELNYTEPDEIEMNNDLDDEQIPENFDDFNELENNNNEDNFLEGGPNLQMDT